MAEEIEEVLRKFSLPKIELGGVDLKVEDIEKRLSIVGRVFLEGLKIGKVFNSVEEVIIPQGGGQEGNHIKLLVELDLLKPLPRGTMIRLEGNQKWVNFKYEKCPKFCYHYGIIGDAERNYSLRVLNNNGSGKAQFGNWLKANTGKQQYVSQKPTPEIRSTESVRVSKNASQENSRARSVTPLGETDSQEGKLLCKTIERDVGQRIEADV
ncbi:hypothetical protein ACH5RR_033976 [Cinchona calisaya]|uniref:Uncharacterized protein n=1 Tax=Cinchona calisaya TaxID=153742 RepID=A0ABD2YD50_9GENT